MAKTLVGSKTHQNLKDAFAEATQTRLQYIAFAKVADTDGRPDIEGLFKDSADAKASQARGHQSYLALAGDSDKLPQGKDSEVQPKDTEANIKSAIAACNRMSQTTLREMAKVAEAEGFEDAAEWLSTAANQEKTSAGRFTRALDSLQY